MRIVVTLILFLLVSPALAGSIVVTVNRTGDPPRSRTFNIPDADIDRIVAAHQRDANVAVNGTATKAQVLDFWITKHVRDDTAAAVKSYERQKAVEAVAEPTPIDPR